MSTTENSVFRNGSHAEIGEVAAESTSYIEKLHHQWLQDPLSVPPSWQTYFETAGDHQDAIRDMAEGPSWDRHVVRKGEDLDIIAAFDGNWTALEEKLADKISRRKGVEVSEADVRAATRMSIRALMLIRAYRARGHLAANLDPLGLAKRESYAELEPETYGFTEQDLDNEIYLDNVLGLETATLRQILTTLRANYCSTFGVQFSHIFDPKQKAWIQKRLEGPTNQISFTKEGKRAILRKLIEAQTFEQFVHKKYPGTKRFGLDGGEALVPGLEQIIKRGGRLGVDEVIIGMPHRGRLNVLAAVMGKPYRSIFHEFKGGDHFAAEKDATGDVKYHLGTSSDRSFDDNNVHLSLTANPSHLEAVNPVVLGKARAKQFEDQQEDSKSARTRVMPLLLHGDAAFAGQGVVAECLSFSELRGHRTGGCVNVIVNNQIGFTTSPRFARSSPYPSDVALMIQSPIFHVNGDDPEAVVHACKVATEFRQEFAKDVVIDMFCYRRFGHNEGDDPSFTQPRMYTKIKTHPRVTDIYAKRLIEEGVITEQDYEDWRDEFDQFLSNEFEAADKFMPDKADWLEGVWSGMSQAEMDDDPISEKTGVEQGKLKKLGQAMSHLPENYDIHKTLRRVIEDRQKDIESGQNIDWATAEHLSFAALLDEGFPVRLSGQDCGRGTFSQRHSHIIDQTTEERYTFLNHLHDQQAPYEVIDSSLSEYGVLGFEYGYALAAPNSLVIWEAQFGDFANGAQIVFDQFVSSGEKKWLRMCGLVMLLPHGYEGQGPEHSSARLERFLQLCGQNNIQVANCTTPANYFHILRRQLHRNFRKPLIMMTPKSLLRHKLCVSPLSDFDHGTSFHHLLWDDADRSKHREAEKDAPPKSQIELVGDDKIKRVVICSGKVYYDLLEEREKHGIDDIYLLRVEQYYPIPALSLTRELSRFKHAQMIWCQEEPKNMGAWSFIAPNIDWVLDQIEARYVHVKYVGRPAMASTSEGIMRDHLAARQALLDEALMLGGFAES